MIRNSNGNILLVILSFIIAAIIWITISNNINPLVHESLSIPIEMRVDDELLDSGRSFSLPTDNQRLLVTYDVRKDDVGKITQDDMSAYVNVVDDVSDYLDINMSFNDKRKLMHRVTYDKEQVLLTVDDMAHKSFKLSYTTRGRLANENLAVSYVSLEPNEIFVNGSATEVAKVNKISIDIDVSGREQNFTGIGKPIIYDSNGKVISNNLTLSSNNVDYMVYIASTKTVAFNTTTNGNVASGFSYAGITVNPSNITISASKEDLQTIQTIDLPIIDITNLQENKEYEFLISDILPKGVKNATQTKTIKVTVMVNNMRREPDIDNRDPFDKIQDKNQEGQIIFPPPIINPTTKAATVVEKTNSIDETTIVEPENEDIDKEQTNDEDNNELESSQQQTVNDELNKEETTTIDSNTQKETNK